MVGWFHETIVVTGRLPLFLFLVAFLITFLFIRLSVRMIRAGVSWWPGNVTPGGLHIHHMVFGMIAMQVSGFALIALASYATPVANAVLAALFGLGSALVLDEFALILHLRDVYWQEEGRASVDAVFVAIVITGLFVLGFHPLGFEDDFVVDEGADFLVIGAVVGFFAVLLCFAIVTLLKGKLWTGLLGLFFVPLLVVGAIRLSRPAAPWARWFYARKPRKLKKSVWRENRLRRPVHQKVVALQEALAGKFDVPPR